MFTSQRTSPDVEALTAALAACPIGGTVTLAALSAAIGRDIQPVRYLIYTAMKVTQGDTGAVFETVRKVGYRRLPIEEIPKVGQTARSRIRRVARRSVAAMSDALTHANDVPPATRQRIYQEQSQIGLLQHIAGRKIREPLDAPLPIARAAEVLMRHLNGVDE